MDGIIVDTPSTQRPYRSHKIPACDLCRRRKLRCLIDVAGQSCRYCREKSLVCHYSQKEAQHDSSRRAKRRRLNADIDGGFTRPGTPPTAERSQPPVESTPASAKAQSSLLLNPPMAEDVEFLAAHGPGGAKPYSVISSGNAIVYLTVPRVREGLPHTEPGRSQRDILEQILSSSQDDVIDLYRYKIHPCFPVLDDMWLNDSTKMPPALLCEVWASTLHLWDTSSRLKHHRRPDVVFCWNLAVAALQEDFLSSTISTVHAAVVDLVGRPVISIPGNISTLGRTVTLAHSLGLHRNPWGWQASDHEKNIRIRLFWGVYVHDVWSSLAHGTPPLIHQQNYDIPLPAFEMLGLARYSEACKRSAVGFIRLCMLSKLLGDLLPCVYTLNPDYQDMSSTIRRLECSLDEWLVSLPAYLKRSSAGNGDVVNGSSSLYFCFLSLKLLLCRVAFKIAAASPTTSVVEEKTYRLAMLRSAASNLVEYVSSLCADTLQEFWLPYTAHLLVSATTTLLRCLVESTDGSIKRDCAAKLVRLQQRLETARNDFQWDLANFCLERCSEPISKIAAALEATENATEPERPQAVERDAPSFGLDFDTSALLEDFFLPVDSLDYPFDALWSI